MLEIKRVSDQEFGWAKILIFGEAGSGKTHLASTYPADKILFINVVSESGLMTLRSKGFDCDVVDVSGYVQMFDTLTYLKTQAHKYELIYIDSLSQWQKALEGEIPECKGNKFEKWNKIKELTKQIVDLIKEVPCHVVSTCEIQRDKDEESGGYLFLPSLLGSSREQISYWFDEVYFLNRTSQKPNAPITYSMLTSAGSKYPCKSRMNLQQVIEKPNLEEIIKNAGFKKEKGEPIKEEKETLSDLETIANKLISLETMEDLTAYFNTFKNPTDEIKSLFTMRKEKIKENQDDNTIN